MIYKIWCKEVDGPGLTAAQKKELEPMDMGSRQDWGEVAADQRITVAAADSLSAITNVDTLRIFAHGSVDKVGQMTAKQLAHYLYDHGLRQVGKIELAACGTAVEKTFKKAYAQRLLEHLLNDPTKSVAITSTQGAKGDLAPDRYGADQDAITLRDGTTVTGNAGKKTYSQQAGCFGMKTVST